MVTFRSSRKKKVAAVLLGLTAILIVRRRRRRRLAQNEERARRKRSVWVKYWMRMREEQGRFSNLIQEVREGDEQCFKNILRMDEETYKELLTTVEGILPQTGMSSVRKPISTREMLAATLQYLAKGSSLLSISKEYGLDRSAVSKFVPEVCQAIYDAVDNDHLTVPLGINLADEVSGSAPTTPASTILPVLPALLTTDESEPCCCSSDDGDLVEAIAETKNALERLSEDDGKDELHYFCRNIEARLRRVTCPVRRLEVQTKLDQIITGALLEQEADR